MTRPSTLALVASLIASLIAAAPATAAPGDRAARAPDEQALIERERVLRRLDTTGAARAELRAVRGRLVLAGWLGQEGAAARRRRVLQQAELQLSLAQRLVTLAQLKAHVRRLQRALARARASIVKTNAAIKQRGAYLNVLRSSR